jgi:hypothetical protein
MYYLLSCHRHRFVTCTWVLVLHPTWWLFLEGVIVIGSNSHSKPQIMGNLEALSYCVNLHIARYKLLKDLKPTYNTIQKPSMGENKCCDCSNGKKMIMLAIWFIILYQLTMATW